MRDLPAGRTPRPGNPAKPPPGTACRADATRTWWTWRASPAATKRLARRPLGRTGQPARDWEGTEIVSTDRRPSGSAPRTGQPAAAAAVGMREHRASARASTASLLRWRRWNPTSCARRSKLPRPRRDHPAGRGRTAASTRGSRRRRTSTRSSAIEADGTSSSRGFALMGCLNPTFREQTDAFLNSTNLDAAAFRACLEEAPPRPCAAGRGRATGVRGRRDTPPENPQKIESSLPPRISQVVPSTASALAIAGRPAPARTRTAPGRTQPDRPEMQAPASSPEPKHSTRA